MKYFEESIFDEEMVKKQKIQITVFACDSSTKPRDYFYHKLIKTFPYTNVCEKYDSNNEKSLSTPGKIRLVGDKNNRRFIAMFTSKEKHESSFRKALDNMAKAKGVKSVLFPFKLGQDSHFTYDYEWDRYVVIIEEFAEKNKHIKICISNFNERKNYLLDTPLIDKTVGLTEYNKLASELNFVKKMLDKAMSVLSNLHYETKRCNECYVWENSDSNEFNIEKGICEKCLYPHENEDDEDDDEDDEDDEEYNDNTVETARTISSQVVEEQEEQEQEEEQEEQEQEQEEEEQEEEQEEQEQEEQEEIGWSYQTHTLVQFVEDYLLSQFEEESGWYKYFTTVIKGGSLEQISQLIEKETSKGIRIFPPLIDVCTVFELCALEDIKVLIIGQDPYHNEGSAMGVAFSHHPGTKKQPSLSNIHKELINDGFDVNFDNENCVDLRRWCLQGVFLYNTTLTVQEGKADSHKPTDKEENNNWGFFSKQLLKFIASNCKQIVVVLWGAKAQKLAEPIFKDTRHKIIKSSHPSPYSANTGNIYDPSKGNVGVPAFFGSKPFSRTNKILESWKQEPIDWSLGIEEDED